MSAVSCGFTTRRWGIISPTWVEAIGTILFRAHSIDTNAQQSTCPRCWACETTLGALPLLCSSLSHWWVAACLCLGQYQVEKGR